MKSMTGFGYGERRNENIQVSIDLKSYNNRYLDISVNVPPFLGPLEPVIRAYLSERVLRGRVEMYVKVRELSDGVDIILDRNSIDKYVQALTDLRSAAGLSDEIRLSHLLKMEGILTVEKNRDIEAYWQLIEPLLAEVFAEFDQSRVREGEATQKDIMLQLERVDTALNEIEKYAPQLEAQIKNNIAGRFREMLGDNVDEQRMYAETAVLLVKYSINEEMARIRSHVDSFKTTAGSDRAVGKKLDFVCQEMNREINTTGSKSVIMEINQSVIEVKDALENIREQLRNVE